jgi:hypothetical protein
MENERGYKIVVFMFNFKRGGGGRFVKKFWRISRSLSTLSLVVLKRNWIYSQFLFSIDSGNMSSFVSRRPSAMSEKIYTYIFNI